MNTCIKCAVEKSIEEFYTKNVCKECRKAYKQEHYLRNPQYYKDKAVQSNNKALVRNRTWLREFLNSHPCEHCGERDHEVLDFDHLDPSIKANDVAHMMTGSLKKLQIEVAKCRVLCANCHRRHTRRQQGWWHDAKVEVTPAMISLIAPDANVVIS